MHTVPVAVTLCTHHATGSLCVGILFISYTVHMKYRPYLETNNTVAEDEWVVGQSNRLKYVSSRSNCFDTP
jgi:hypothetical protein